MDHSAVSSFRNGLLSLAMLSTWQVVLAEEPIDRWGRPVLQSNQVTAAIGPSSPVSSAWVWATLGRSIGRNLLDAADLDGDGQKELITAGGGSYDGLAAVFVLESNLTDFVCMWDSVNVRDYHITQMDSDRALEVVLVTSSSVLTMDGATCAVESETALPGGTTSAGLGDVDADGSPEVVYTIGNDLFMAPYNDFSAPLKRLGFGGDMIVVESLGRSGGDDIAVVGPVTYVLKGDDLSTIIELSPVDIRCDFGDFDGDGFGEIVAASGSEVVTVDLATGQSTVVLDDWADVVRASDIDGDGNDEILVGNNQWGNFSIVDGDGSLIHSIRNPENSTSGVLADDLDNDGTMDFFWGSGPRLIRGALSSADPIWQSADLDGPFQLAAPGAYDSGGANEIAVSFTRSESGYDIGGLVILNDDSGAELDHFLANDSGWGHVTAVVAGNIDADPGWELCYTGNESGYELFLACRDYATNTVEWFREIPYGLVYHLALDDFDRDSSLEILLVSDEGVVSLHSAETGFLEWVSEELWTYSYVTFGYDDVVGVDDEIWVVSPNNKMHRLDSSSGEKIATVALISQLAQSGGNVYAVELGTGAGILDPQTFLLDLVYPSAQPLTALEVSPDGGTMLVATGDRPDLAFTLVPLRVSLSPLELGTIRAWDEQLAGVDALYIANPHGAVRFNAGFETVFADSFE